VALHPVSRATVDIPVIRQEIEAQGHRYDYELLARETRRPPAWARTALCPEAPVSCLHITALHSADGAPYVFEDRWISLNTVPTAADQDFKALSANEWLVSTAPYTHGDISFTAAAASETAVAAMKTDPATPLFVIERTTWDHDRAITTVRLSYAPGYRIRTRIGG